MHNGSSRLFPCFLTNARSLKNKVNELQQVLYSDKPKLFFICETWLTNDIPDNFLDPEQNYTIFRSDRLNRVGGGSCAFISRDIDCHKIEISNAIQPDYKLCGCDIVCFNITVHSTNYRFILIYRPPHSSLKTEIPLKTTALINVIEKLSDLQITTFILGDLNFPDINWMNSTFKTNGIDDVFFNGMSLLGMNQFVCDPTRMSKSNNNNILDLIFSNDPLSVHIADHLAPLSTSDHHVIEFSIFTTSSHNNVTTDDDSSPASTRLPIYKWSEANFVAINDQLKSIDWHQLFGSNFDAESIWSGFKSIIWPIIDIHTPKTMIHHSKKYKTRVYPKHIRKLLNRKAAIWRQMKQNSNPTVQTAYNNIARECKIAITRFDADREEKMLNSNNLGAFYRFVNKKLSDRSGIAPLVNDQGILISSDIERAELLNDYFVSVFTCDNGIVPPFESRFPADDPQFLEDIEISPGIVGRALGRMKMNASAGPDKIPPIFFRKTGNSLSFPLALMFRTFIDLHTLPTEWKSSNITPKHKKGPVSAPSNYRPISLTCTCCKLLESLIAAELVNFLNKHKLISKHQHGFLKRHSTCTNLLESLNDWTLSICTSTSVAIAYIDFARAFDSISHSKLITKLICYGIRGNLLYWVDAFLTNRTQRVLVGSSFSSVRSVISGVPQGKHLKCGL